ncbi:MAG TPA: 2,3-bisphosphoglycerate-independent phosphoglycerate mutase [Opitutales bacterium]|nr:2,3-bisphosphoglycerate-independent phosphoglycerate mutase [Opitutales bacterium]
MSTYQPTLLIIRDGWGANPDLTQDKFNAVKQAHTPCDDRLRANYPMTKIQASGLDVGLPAGIMGNSEVGHQNIGAGRIVDQELVRINKALEGGEVRENPVFAEAVKRVRERGTTFHLMGIVSDAGVHGMLDHLYRLLELLKEEEVTKVLIHAFTDGRDTSPTSGLGFIREVEAKCREIGIGRIATVCGRFWSMDRDNRWERVEKAYACLTGNEKTETAENAEAAVLRYYENPLDPSRTGDEFVTPTRIVDADGEPVGAIEDGDVVLFYNYRGDRPRELTKAFVEDDFVGFERGKKLDLFFVTMTEYETGLPVEVLFRKPPKMKNILGSYVSDRGIPQFRCAETEKYPHVTFFFNDYREEPFPLEERVVAPSPKIATYDLQPEMSADAVMEATREAILSKKFGLIVVNFANPDMVAHTGSLEATVRAVEKVDACVAVLLEALAEVGGKGIVTADHGNAEQLWDPVNNSPHTSHTLNQVELYVVGDGYEKVKLRAGGRLADVAPTLLDLMELEKPEEMTGESLIVD